MILKIMLKNGNGAAPSMRKITSVKIVAVFLSHPEELYVQTERHRLNKTITGEQYFPLKSIMSFEIVK